MDELAALLQDLIYRSEVLVGQIANLSESEYQRETAALQPEYMELRYQAIDAIETLGARGQIILDDLSKDSFAHVLHLVTARQVLGGLKAARAIVRRPVDVEAPALDSDYSRQSNSQADAAPVADPQAVFVVHGRDRSVRDAMFAFLRAIGLHPLEWAEVVKATGKPTPYIGEILEAAFSSARAVVVLMTPDDEARLREPFREDGDDVNETKLTPQARPNVLFEAGMAMGGSPDRTILVEVGVLRPFSDIGGRHVIRLDDSMARRQQLAQRLQSAGCPVNLAGIDWHTAGRFEVG